MMKLVPKQKSKLHLSIHWLISSFLLLILTTNTIILNGQPDPEPAYSCEEVVVYNDLDDLDGVTFDMLEPWSPNIPYPLCPSGGFAHNPVWFGFIPASETVTLILHATNCSVGGGQQIGFQWGIYTDCTFEESVICQPNCELPGDVEISYDLFTPGEEYYLFIDGCNGTICTIWLEVVEGGGGGSNTVENDDPCYTSNHPPYDLTGGGSHQGSTCFAVGYNDDPDADWANQFCPDIETNDNAVWYSFYLNPQYYDAFGLSVDGSIIGNTSIEVYSGQSDAGCSGELTYLNSSCSELPTQIYQSSNIGPNDIFFVKVATSDENCGDFNITMTPLSDCNVADDCEDITQDQTLYPVTDSQFTELEYECLSGCLDLATPEDPLPAGGFGCDFSILPTVWYAIEVDDIAAQLFTTVNTHGSWTPMWSVYYGDDCGNLVNAATGNTPYCSLDDASPDIHQTGVEYLYSTYYVAVSADPNGSPIDDPNFEICTATFINVLVCLGDIEDNCEPDPSTEIKVVHREHPELEPDYDPEVGYMGPFCPGEEVDIELSFFYDATETGADWFMGFVPDFGAGWDMESIDFEAFLPTSTGGNGGPEWHEPNTDCEATIEEPVPHLCTYTDENGVLRLCNALCESCTECEELGMDDGDILPAGYFWTTDGSNSGCVSGSCRPGEQWGIGSTTTQLNWDFTIRVKEFDSTSECLSNRDLQIAFQTFSDGLAGCWEDPVGECLIDRKQLGPLWEVSCIDESVQLMTVDEVQTCSGSPLAIELAIESGDSLDIHVDYMVNPYIQGARAHLFTGGIGVITDTLYLTDSICEPVELIYLAFVSLGTNCGFNTYDSIRVMVHPRAQFSLDTLETTCYPNTESYNLMDYLQCDSISDSLFFEWHEIGGSHVDSSSVIQMDSTFNYGFLSFAVEIWALPSCDPVMDTLHLFNPSPLMSNLVITHETEEGYQDGRATANPQGGLSPYSFSWSTGDTLASIEGLSSGIYSLTLTDALGCTLLDTFEILSGQCIGIEAIVDIYTNSCAGICDASIDLVNVLNATPPFTLQWSTGDTLTQLDSLCSGAYFLTLTDAEDCTATFEIEVDGPDPVESNINGTNESHVEGQDGIAWVDPSGGLPPYQFTWSNDETSDTINALAPGWYSVSISDANDCMKVDSIEILEFQCDSLSVIFDQIDAMCEGECNGAIIIQDVLFGTPPYTYYWNNGQDDSLLSYLCSGVYAVTITDSLGCSLVQEFEISHNLEIVLEVDTILNITENGFGAILVSVEDKDDHRFEWSGPNGYQSQSESILNLSEEGCYTLTVTHNATGCMKDTTICIIDETVGLSQISQFKDLLLFPNPANNAFVVQHPDINLNELEVTLYTSTGDQLEAELKEIRAHELSFDSEMLNSGIYLLKIQWKNEVAFRRIAIIH